MSPVGSIRRDRPVGNPDVDQRLHRLRVLVREQAVQLGNAAEVDEAGVDISPALVVVGAAQVPERVDPVRVVEMGVDAEDLAEACAHIVDEALGKASILSRPLATSQSRSWSLEISRSSRDRSLPGWGAEASRSKGSSISIRRISWECLWVVDLSIHPALDQRDILMR